MKKIVFFAILMLSLCACSKVSTTSDEFVPLDTIVCTRTISIYPATKAVTVKPVELTLAASYDVNNDVITSFSISSPDSEIDIDELKETVKERFEEENGFPLENTDLNRIMDTALSSTSSDFSTKDCFMSCQDLKKGEGRGWCRAGCILDCILHILPAILEAFD